MIVYVPLDGIGPSLVGSNATYDYERPKGYDEVRLVGRPQVTFSGGSETGHARDSVEEALSLAATNQFSEIYFNRSLMTSTRGTVRSFLRPDVLAVVRSDLKPGYLYHHYETLSPRQELEFRQEQFNSFPNMNTVDGRWYKIYGLILSPYFLPLEI